MKPPLPFQSVEVKQKQHCVNHINFFGLAYQCLPQARSLAVTEAAVIMHMALILCTLFKIVASNVSGQLLENGMMLLELKQSCANSLCTHIGGKDIDSTMDNDPFRNVFIKYLILQIKKSSVICIIYSAMVFGLLHCFGPLAIKTLKANLTRHVTGLAVHVLNIPSKRSVLKC